MRIVTIRMGPLAGALLPPILLATSCLSPGTLEDEDAFPLKPDPSQAGGSGGESSSSGGSGAPPLGSDAGETAGCAEACALLTQKCGGLGCHASESPAAGVDFASSGLIERISNSTVSTPSCSGESVLVPGAPDQSLVYTKLLDPPSCGLRMPLGLPLADAEIECIRRWVESPSCDTSPDPLPTGAGGSGPGAGGSPPMGMGGSLPMGMGGSPEPEEDAAPPDPPLDRNDWTVSASSQADEPPSNAIDGDIATRWSSGVEMAGGEYFEIDFGSEQSISTLVIDATGSANDFPRGYEVFASNDPNDFGTPIVSGSGQLVTTIDVTGTRARYVRIQQTGAAEYWWSIHELTAER